ncbi:MAG: hypothetical protein KIT58_03430, partial [Planctomycetota bacterium]|nr:hypothetical protein [Planctomycetota bacterium]
MTWIASLDQAGVTAGYGLLRDPEREDDATLSSSFARDEWRAALAELLRDHRVVPAFAEGKLVMRTFESVLDLPDELARVFDEPQRRGDLLFGRPVLATKVLKKSGLEFLRWVRPVDRLSASQAAEAVSSGVSLWWSALESDELTRLQVLAELWASFEKHPAFAKLPLVPTESNEWLRAEDAIIVDGTPRGESDIEREVLEFLRPELPAPEKLVARGVLDALRARSKDGRAPAEFVAARRWIDSAVSKVTLDAIVRRRLERVASEADPPIVQVIRIGQWARSVGRTGLLSHVVVDVQGVSRVVPIESALVAEPYVSTGAARRALHEGAPAISAEYVLSDPFGADLNVWRVAFETGKALGPLRVEARTGETWSRKEAEAFLGTELSDSSRRYSLTDYHFVPEIRECALSKVAPLLEEGTADRRSTSRREVSWFFRQPKGPRQGSDAAWLRVLKTLRWVPSSTGTLHTVDEVLLQPDPSVEDAPIAGLSPSLA